MAYWYEMDLSAKSERLVTASNGLEQDIILTGQASSSWHMTVAFATGNGLFTA
jgi:hypothetical protein